MVVGSSNDKNQSVGLKKTRKSRKSLGLKEARKLAKGSWNGNDKFDVESHKANVLPVISDK